jgi:hypothetical protein
MHRRHRLHRPEEFTRAIPSFINISLSSDKMRAYTTHVELETETPKEGIQIGRVAEAAS